jgi:hypothetical protein
MAELRINGTWGPSYPGPCLSKRKRSHGDTYSNNVGVSTPTHCCRPARTLGKTEEHTGQGGKCSCEAENLCSGDRTDQSSCQGTLGEGQSGC